MYSLRFKNTELFEFISLKLLRLKKQNLNASSELDLTKYCLIILK